MDSSAKELEGQATILKNLASYFKIKDRGQQSKKTAPKKTVSKNELPKQKIETPKTEMPQIKANPSIKLDLHEDDFESF